MILQKKLQTKMTQKLNNTGVAVYAGTFDPVTNGHVDIITRASTLYDKVYVAVSDHGRKKTFFNLKERLEAMNSAIKHLDNVEVVGFTNLLYQLVEELGAGVVVRGLRMTSDFDYEFQMAEMNHNLSAHFETVFLMARSEHSTISSTTVKEVAGLGGDISRFVPAHVQKMLEKIYDRKNGVHPTRFAGS